MTFPLKWKTVGEKKGGMCFREQYEPYAVGGSHGLGITAKL